MVIALANTRLILISGQAFLGHLGTYPAGRGALLWQIGDYGRTFNGLRGGQGDDFFAFAWRKTQRSEFWRAYCNGQPLDQVSARAGWDLMVPLRLVDKTQPKVSLRDGGTERIFYDVYGYPHGLVTAITLQSPSGKSMSLDDWCDRTRTLRSAPVFGLEVGGKNLRDGLCLDEVLTLLNDWHRAAYYRAIDDFIPSYEPFSIVAVIQGSGVDPEVPVSTQPDLQKTLNAVTAWPKNWQGAVPPEIEKAILTVGQANRAPGDALYADKRGRTLWRPGLFTYERRPDERLHTLSCLAHNLVAGAVQAESLRLLAIAFAALPPNVQATIPIDFLAKAAGLIAKLWAGDATYRSSSIRHQFEDTTGKSQINALLTRFGQAPIP